MTFIALLTAVYRKFNAAIKNRQAYYELRDLPSAQLRDIGLRIEKGVVVFDVDSEVTQAYCK
ncbi:MAG: hypothetical protein V7731_14265 [Amphritea sp.]